MRRATAASVGSPRLKHRFFLSDGHFWFVGGFFLKGEFPFLSPHMSYFLRRAGPGCCTSRRTAMSPWSLCPLCCPLFPPRDGRSGLGRPTPSRAIRLPRGRSSRCDTPCFRSKPPCLSSTVTCVCQLSRRLGQVWCVATPSPPLSATSCRHASFPPVTTLPCVSCLMSSSLVFAFTSPCSGALLLP